MFVPEAKLNLVPEVLTVGCELNLVSEVLTVGCGM
jgi:hypothetical protein